MGEKKLFCGDNKTYRVSCPSGLPGHHNRIIVQGCKTLQCPVCWPEAINHEAGAASERLRGIKTTYRKQLGLDLGWPYHFSFSPPPEQYRKGPEKLKEQALKHAKSIGIIGGCIVQHDIRTEGRNNKEKQEIIEQYRRKELELPYSLHFHIVGFAPNFDARLQADEWIRSDSFHRRTSWTYRNHGAQNPRRRNMDDKRRNLYKTIRYELSHAHIEERRHALTWWGMCAYNNVVVEKIIERKDDICEICGRQNHLYLDDQDQGEHQIKRIHKHYKISSTVKIRIMSRYADILGMILPTCETLAEVC